MLWIKVALSTTCLETFIMRLLLDLQLYDGFRARYHGKVAHSFQRPLRQR